MNKITNDLRQIYYNDNSIIFNTEENTNKSSKMYSMLFRNILETTKDNPILQEKLFELDEIDGERLDEILYEGYEKGFKKCLNILEQQEGKTMSLLQQYYKIKRLLFLTERVNTEDDKIEVYSVIHNDVTELLKLYQNLLSNYLTLKDIINNEF